MSLQTGLGLDKIPPTMIHLNYNGNMHLNCRLFVVESILQKIAVYLNWKFELKSGNNIEFGLAELF